MISLNVHRCTAITAQFQPRRGDSGTTWVDVRFETEDGSVFEITAFTVTEALAQQVAAAISPLKEPTNA